MGHGDPFRFWLGTPTQRTENNQRAEAVPTSTKSPGGGIGDGVGEKEKMKKMGLEGKGLGTFVDGGQWGPQSLVLSPLDSLAATGGGSVAARSCCCPATD